MHYFLIHLEQVLKLLLISFQLQFKDLNELLLEIY
jgi:hypothetical protein